MYDDRTVRSGNRAGWRGGGADAGGVSARGERSEEYEGVLFVFIGKGAEVDAGAVCGPGDAGAPGVHSRASGSWKIRRGWASARSGTDRGNGDYQRGVDR